MDFNEQIGDILFRGFWQGGKSENGVVNPKARINKKAPVSYAEAQAFKYKLGALKPHIIVVDYDTDESFYAAVKIAQSKGEHFIAIKGAHKGGHLYYYNNTHSITKASNHNETALSLYPADYKLGCKKVKDEYKPSDSYAALSNDDGSDREVICFNPSDDGTLDEIPFYHRPIKSAAEHKFLGMDEGDGRNESLYTFMIDLKKSGFTYEEYLESVSLINEHLFSNPLPTDEFETVTRRSEWESIDAGDDKKTVSPATFMEFLRGKGIQIKYNEALNIVEYTGMDNLPGYRKVNDSANYNPVILQYAYRDYIHNKSISKQQTCDLIGLIADQNAYNPIKDYLTDGVWDGADRFQAVFDFLQITDEFEQILVKKWFIQTAAMPFNTLDHSLQPEGVLILQGDEGIGKTRFFRLMTPNARWFSSLDKEMTTKNKDIVLEMLSAWIAEIGEFDRTTRANKSDLKNFMTQDKDTIRKPYAKEPLTKARTTSFCGTTNEERFLNSDTGSRRWWVIHLAAEKTFDFEHILNGVELHQFWLQCYHLFSENAASFRLTDEEKQIMKIRNGVAMETKPAEDELMAWMDFDASKEKWVELTASDFIIQNPIFDRYTPKEIGAALSSLKKNYYPELQVRHGKKGNIWFMPPINRIWNSAIENAEKTVDDLVNR